VADTPPTLVLANSRLMPLSSLTASRYCTCAEVARTRTLASIASKGMPSASVRYTAATRATSMSSVARCSFTWTSCAGVHWSPDQARYCATLAYRPGSGTASGLAATVAAWEYVTVSLSLARTPVHVTR
jgi:hypothetical protein